ncbi:MAG: hypothetical protein WCR95_00055 [Eubacteriales bacterium]
MFERIKCKIIWSSIMIAVISGLVAGATVSCIENRETIAKKCKKAFKQLEDKIL